MQRFDWNEEDSKPRHENADIEDENESAFPPDEVVDALSLQWGGSWNYDGSTGNPQESQLSNYPPAESHRDIQHIPTEPTMKSNRSTDSFVIRKPSPAHKEPLFFLDAEGNNDVQEEFVLDSTPSITKTVPLHQRYTAPFSSKKGWKTDRGKRGSKTAPPNVIDADDDMDNGGSEDAMEPAPADLESDLGNEISIQKSSSRRNRKESRSRREAAMQDYIENTGGIDMKSLEAFSFLSVDRDPAELQVSSEDEDSDDILDFDSDEDDSEESASDDDDDDNTEREVDEDETDDDLDGLTYFGKDVMQHLPGWDGKKGKAGSSSNLVDVIQKYNDEQKFHKILNGIFKTDSPEKASRSPKRKGKKYVDDEMDGDENTVDNYANFLKSMRQNSKEGKKAQKKEQRREARQKKKDLIEQGIIPPNLSHKERKAAFREMAKKEKSQGTDWDPYDVQRQLENFLNDYGMEALSFPPMSREVRRNLHALAQCYLLKSKSMGSGVRRYTVVSKSARSALPRSNVQVNRVIHRWKLDAQFSGNGTSPAAAGKKNRSSGGGGGGRDRSGAQGQSLAPGTVVGGTAPPISQTNIGHRMLLRMGWQTGQSLGNEATDAGGSFEPTNASDGGGDRPSGRLKEPLTAVVRGKRVGLGHE